MSDTYRMTNMVIQSQAGWSVVERVEKGKLEFPPFHGRLSAEEFSAGMVAFTTGDCSDFA